MDRDRGARNYAWEKFFDGVRSLAQGTGAPQDRLQDAWIYSLHHAKPEGIPEEKREAFTHLRDALGEGKGRSLGEVETSNLIDEVISIFMAICEAKSRD